MDDAKKKSSEEVKDEKIRQSPNDGAASKAGAMEPSSQNKNSGSSSNDQDLDVFLLGDLGDGDDVAGTLKFFFLLD